MVSAWERGVRDGLAPWEARKISSQCTAKAGMTWARTRRTSQVRRDERGSAQPEQSEHSSGQDEILIMIVELILTLFFISGK
jgi:hypothetical protein